MEPQIQIKKLILSTKGQLEIDQTSNILVLGHENLHPQISKVSSKPLTIETINFHKQNLFTLENSSITPTLIQHQIHQRLAKQSNLNQVLIVDSSPTLGNQKTADILKKFHIVRGYNYELPSALNNVNLQTLSKESEVLISKEHISKELEYVFGVIGQQQRGFIGEIDLPYHYRMSQSSKIYEQTFLNLFSCYQNFCAKTNCPIYINLLQHGSNAFSIEYNSANRESQSHFMNLINFLLGALLKNKEIYKNIVLINPSFAIQRSFEYRTIKYSKQNKHMIEDLYNLGFTICFDLSRYQNQICLAWIAQYIQSWVHQTIVSAGLKFRTDFVPFGGEGYILSQSIKHFGYILGEQRNQFMNVVTKQNVLKLLTWYQKKIIKVQVKTWKCIKCAKQSPQTEQSFRKFGKDFCSIDCLRAYNF